MIRAFFPLGGGLRGMSDRDDGDALGWLPEQDPAVARIEPGAPTVENVAFVLLGALATLFAFGRVAGLV